MTLLDIVLFLPLVGFLRSASIADAAHLVTAFRAGLKEAGFVDGQNVAIEYRSAEDHPDRLPALVADLVRRPVAVIAATRGPGPARAAKAATSTIPIVVALSNDLVADGLGLEDVPLDEGSGLVDHGDEDLHRVRP